jgi:PAS domain S-box-containing protein
MPQDPLRRVLIVDDSHADRYAKSDALKKAGLAVIVADGKASAISALQEHFATIWAVVVGMNLPDNAAREVCRWVRQNHPNIPCMRTAAASAGPMPEGSSHDLEAGALPIEQAAGEAFVSQVQALLRMRDAEQALHVSQDAERQAMAELAIIYDTAPIGLAVLSPDKRFLRINERLAEINGRPVCDHIGRTIREVVPALADQAHALIDHIVATGEPVLNVEIEGETAAEPGVRRTWLEQLQPVKDASGKVTAINIVAEDITDKKRHEQQLRERERLLKAVLDALPLGVGLTRTDGEVTLANARFRHYVPAHIPSRDESRAALWEAYDTEGLRIPPENYPGARALRGEDVIPGTDFLFHPPDAAPAWTRVAAVPFRNDSGEIQGAIAVVSDIDCERHAIEDMRQSELRYRQLFEANPHPMFIYDTETLSFLAVNASALELYGYSREEFAALSMDDIRPPEDVPHLRKQVAANGGRKLTRDSGWRHRKKDGTIFDVEATSHQIEFDGRPARLVLVHDVTARKRAEEALLQSENRLRLAMEASSTGMWEWDIHTQSLTWSPECYAILGLTPESVDGIGASIDDLLHPEDRERVKRSFREAVSRGTKLEAEFRINRPDGEVRWLATIGRASYDRDGHPQRMSGTMSDITERRRTEEHNRILMREVNHRSKNLLAVVQAIAAQTTSKGDPRTFALRFSERLQGLAASHDLLVHNQWRGVGLAELVASQIAPFRSALKDRISLDGPALHINTAAAQSLGLALHELATNAGKYGSLSEAEGNVRISWQVDKSMTPVLFRMKWEETGGPRVKKPERKGFGTVLLADMIRTSLQGKVQLDYAPQGFCWTLEAPVENLLEAGFVSRTAS